MYIYNVLQTFGGVKFASFKTLLGSTNNTNNQKPKSRLFYNACNQ